MKTSKIFSILSSILFIALVFSCGNNSTPAQTTDLAEVDYEDFIFYDGSYTAVYVLKYETDTTSSYPDETTIYDILVKTESGSTTVTIDKMQDTLRYPNSTAFEEGKTDNPESAGWKWDTENLSMTLNYTSGEDKATYSLSDFKMQFYPSEITMTSGKMKYKEIYPDRTIMQNAQKTETQSVISFKYYEHLVEDTTDTTTGETIVDDFEDFTEDDLVCTGASTTIIKKN